MAKIQWHDAPRGVMGTDGMGLVVTVQRGVSTDFHVSFTIYAPDETGLGDVVEAVEAATKTLYEKLGMGE